MLLLFLPKNGGVIRDGYSFEVNAAQGYQGQRSRTCERILVRMRRSSKLQRKIRTRQ